MTKTKKANRTAKPLNSPCEPSGEEFADMLARSLIALLAAPGGRSYSHHPRPPMRAHRDTGEARLRFLILLEERPQNVLGRDYSNQAFTLHHRQGSDL